MLGAGVAASRWLVRPAVPDDTDAFGFALGMGETYDLSLFQPQFPGYPVFVFAGKVLCWCGLSGLAAATLLAALSSGAAAVALGLIAWKLAGDFRAAVAAAALHAVAFLPWLLGSSALSDGPGLALAAGALAALLWERALLAGLLGGLLLGTRLSYLPLLLPLLARRRAVQGLLAATLAWLCPFVAFFGPRTLFGEGLTHLRGHFTGFGGSIATRPSLVQRGEALFRGLFYDGLAPSLWALGALAVLLVLTARRKPAAKPFLAALAPYGVWAFLGQNLIEQPRHLLPLVEGLLVLLALLLEPRWVAAAALILAAASAPLLLERLRTPPAAAQAAAWIAAHGQPAHALVAARRSARFFRAAGLQTQEHFALSDVIGTLARMDSLPQPIWLTSELSAAPADHWTLSPGPAFCRDARLGRAQPCLSLVQLSWSPR